MEVTSKQIGFTVCDQVLYCYSERLSCMIWVKHTSLLSCTWKIISLKYKEINYGDNAD